MIAWLGFKVNTAPSFQTAVKALKALVYMGIYKKKIPHPSATIMPIVSHPMAMLTLPLFHSPITLPLPAKITTNTRETGATRALATDEYMSAFIGLMPRILKSMQNITDKAIME